MFTEDIMICAQTLVMTFHLVADVADKCDEMMSKADHIFQHLFRAAIVAGSYIIAGVRN